MNFHDFIRDSEGWEMLGSELQFENPYAQLFLATVRTPSSPRGRKWTIVHRKGSAVIAPQTEDGRFLLIRQERIPIRAAIWEFPAGQIDDSSEHSERLIRDTATRELREETGYELAPDGEMIPLGYFFSSPGFTDEHGYLFLARPVVPSATGHQHDENETITECRAFSPGELRAMIAQNEIRDANTLAAFARMTALGLI